MAGIDIATGEWVRPVSLDRGSKGAVLQSDIKYDYGSEVQPLDVVRIKLATKQRKNFIQPENFFYDAGYRWQRLGRYTIAQVLEQYGYTDRDFIFYNNDRKVHPRDMPQQAHESLLLLRVKVLSVRVEIGRKKQKKFYLDISYNDELYKRISVSDLNVRQYYAGCPEGTYDVNKESIVTCSLTNPYKFNGYCYKMVAQVFKVP